MYLFQRDVLRKPSALQDALERIYEVFISVLSAVVAVLSRETATTIAIFSYPSYSNSSSILGE